MTYPRNDNAIYDDDPNAVSKLKAKIANLEAQRDRVKEVNAAFRRHKIDLTKISPEEWSERLEPLELTADEIKYIGEAMRISKYGRGYEPWHLTNLTSNINRLRKRLRYLEADVVTA